MEKNNKKLRYILQYCYDEGTNAAQACEKICAVYGEGTISKSAARKWFARFRSGNFDVKDESRSGRPIIEKAEETLKKVPQAPKISNYVPTERHFREVLLFLFNSKRSAAESHRLLLETYGEHTIPSIETCECWFQRFKSGDFDTSDKDLSAPPKKLPESKKRGSNLKRQHQQDTQYEDLLRRDSSYTIGQVKILNPNSDLLEEPPPVRREDLIPNVNRHLTLDENLNPPKSRSRIKRPRGYPDLNPIASPNKDDISSISPTENYNITNMPFGDLEYLIKSDNEQSDTSSNLIQEDVIEPLVEIKIEQND